MMTFSLSFSLYCYLLTSICYCSCTLGRSVHELLARSLAGCRRCYVHTTNLAVADSSRYSAARAFILNIGANEILGTNHAHIFVLVCHACSYAQYRSCTPMCTVRCARSMMCGTQRVVSGAVLSLKLIAFFGFFFVLFLCMYL